MKSSRKIWLGVGAFVVAGSGAVVADSPPSSDTLAVADVRSAQDRAIGADARPSSLMPFVMAQHDGHATQSAESGGEGGEEGGEGGVAQLPPELAFAARIALLRGHLRIGDELVRQNEWTAALPHFLHPSEEIYADIKDELADYGTSPFEDALKALSDIVKAKRGGLDYDRALKAVHDACAAAEAGMKRKQGDGWAAFAVATAVETVKAAAGEYENAIVGGRIAKPVEYQDARGFVFEADRMVENVAPALEQKDAAALRLVRAALAELKAIFPQAMPPRTPVKEHGEMLAAVSRLELAAGHLM